MPRLGTDIEMDKSDIEMVDSVKHINDSENNLKGTENMNVGTDEEIMTNGTEDDATVKSEVEGQIKSTLEDEVLMNMDTKAEEQMDAAEEQTDLKNEVVEQSSVNGGVEEENPSGNGMEGGNTINNAVEEKSNEIGSVAEDVDPVENVAVDEKIKENSDAGNNSSENKKLATELSANEVPQSQNTALDAVPQGEDEEMEDTAKENGNKAFKEELEELAMTVETPAKIEVGDAPLLNPQEPATPTSLVINSAVKAGDYSGETAKPVYTQGTFMMGESDDGTPEDQAAFMKEIESFYRERAMDFKPPKFYGQPLNCLKLWRAVIRLGGYERVTGSKLWRQVGESFHPPKTCTTVSWTFRIFYEKSLLEFERHKIQSGELQIPMAAVPEASVVDEGPHQASGRARRDSASRAMQGWHSERLSASGEVGEPIIKDKNLNNVAKHEKNLKSIGSLKQKRPNDVEHSSKVARTETFKQLVTSVVDVGSPADWVKINVRQTHDCFEVYALVPGLLREEVRVQSDPAGRLVITGQPEQVDNPWGITPFKKVVSLPARIDPLQTSAVVSLHGRLFVRVPFEQ